MRALRRLAAALLVVCAAVVTVPVPAGAVTYGTVVAYPSRTIPWLLPLFYSRTGADDASFVCSTSALSPREVLTAAHCVQQRGFYYVLVGADTLSGGHLVPIEVITDHSRYTSRSVMNDAAIMRPLFPLGLRAYARLAPPELIQRISTPSPPTLKLVAWGRNQNRRVNGYLHSALVRPQGKTARAAFGRYFRPDLMLAAGRYLPRLGIYAGACHGDSGGPLVAMRKGTPYVAGITSYIRTCTAKAPTVFTNVGAYRSWIKTAQRALPRRAATENRALPWNMADPTLSGTVALGSVLGCNPGTWTSNTTDVRTSWLRAGTVVGTSASHTITAADGGQSLACAVTATSQAGSRTVTSKSIAVPAPPSGPASPTVSGFAESTMPTPGTLAVCMAPRYPQPGMSWSYSWAWSATATAESGTPLASGPNLILTEDVLRTVAGRYLICTTTASNAMGSHTASDTAYVPALRPPAIGVNTSPLSVQAGSMVACLVQNFGSTPSSTTYRWGIQSTRPGDTLDPSAMILPHVGAMYAVTSSDIAAMSGDRFLVCEATASNWQGSDTAAAYSTSY